MRSGRLLVSFVLFHGILWLAGSGPAASEWVDRILAVVNNEIITLSDVQKNQTLFGEGQDAQVMINELIDQKLLMSEARKFEIPEPSDDSVDAAYQDLVRRFEDKEALTKTVEQMGLSELELRLQLKARLRVGELLDQRVTFFVFVAPQEVEAYYEEHADDFSGQSAEQAKSAILDLLTRQKAELKRKEYLDRLRSRATIRIN